MLSDRDLVGVDLTGARLAHADLRGAMLAGADLSNADLSFAKLLGADLYEAKLTGSRLLGTKLLGAKGLSGQLRASAEREGAAVLAATATAEIALKPSDCTTVAYHPGGHLLATGHHDHTVRLWDATTGQELRALLGHTALVSSVTFSPDSRLLASGCEDKTVRLWDAVTGHELRALSGHDASVRSVVFSPDGLSLASGSFDGTIRLWDVASGRCLAVLLSTPEGWVSYIPEAHPGGPPRGAFKMGGDIAGSFWHIIGLARFEPGELDEFLPEGQKLRLPDDYLFLPPAPK